MRERSAEAGLAGCFDLGFSFGITDDVFRPQARRSNSEIGMVGINNPFGNGVCIDVTATHPDLLDIWLRQAVRQVRRPEVDMGETDERSAERESLITFLEGSPVESCTLSIFPLGIGYLRIMFRRVRDHRLMARLLTAYEYAAYRPEFSDAVLEAGRSVVAEATAPGATQSFVAITTRPTGGKRVDADGYEQSDLFPSFTRIIRMEPEDAGPALTRFWEIDGERVVDFEYHGLLYYSWPTCLLVRHGKRPWTASQELARIEECICIAHVAAGACEALLRLCEDEIKKQVESLVARRRTVRGSRELNRLRTFSLAVVTLSDLRRVTACDEDQTYFRWFAEDAGLPRNQRLMTESVEILYNVQDAEMQREHSARESLLNAVLAVLASLTLVSVSADAYNFVSGSTSLVSQRAERVHLLAGFLAAIVLLTAILLYVLARPARPRREEGGGRGPVL